MRRCDEMKQRRREQVEFFGQVCLGKLTARLEGSAVGNDTVTRRALGAGSSSREALGTLVPTYRGSMGDIRKVVKGRYHPSACILCPDIPKNPVLLSHRQLATFVKVRRCSLLKPTGFLRVL